MDDEPKNLSLEELRPTDFPFPEWLGELEKAAARLTGNVRQSARHAFVHLRKAWKLHGLDDEMSAFRAITAEEEAATALIHALKQQRYSGVEFLKHHNHSHKNAFWPLISAINDMFVAIQLPAPRVFISREGPPRVTIQLDMTALAGHKGEPVWIEPVPPLHFSIRSGQAGDAVVHLFEAELAALADKSGEKSILRYIQGEANRRNLLLYASSDGLPKAEFHDDALRNRAFRVGVIVALAIIVVQTPEHQTFIQQCLDALLHALEKIDRVLGEYANDEPSDLPRISFHRGDGKPSVIALTRQVQITGWWNSPVQHWRYQLALQPAVKFTS